MFNSSAQKAGLEYLLIGGYAASYWGSPRFTADIDFSVKSSDFEKVNQVMQNLDYTIAFKHPKGSFAHFLPIKGSNFRVDFVIVDSSTWKELYDSKSLVEFGKGLVCPIVSPLHLIAMKLHAAKQSDRTEYLKDLSDVVEIMIKQEISFNFLEENGILKKYGSESTLNELTRLLRARKEVP